MKKLKVLFIESESFYQSFLNLNYSVIESTFDGGYFLSEGKFLNYDLVVYTIYSSLRFNFIISKLRNHNIPVLLMFDGVAEFSNFDNNQLLISQGMENYHPVVSDYLCVVGDKASRYFTSRGCEVFKFMPENIKSKSVVDLPKNNVVLITSANTAYYNDLEFYLLLDLMKQTVELLNNSKVEYIFRIFDKRLIEGLEIVGNNYTDGSYENILIKVSHVITTPSSISLTSMYHQRPVAHFTYRDCPLFFQSGWNVIPGCISKHWLDSFLSFDEKRMAFQHSEVTENFSCEDITRTFSLIVEKYNFKHNEVEFYENIFYKMLSSKYNINVEFTIRKFYWKLKRTRFSKFIKLLRKTILGI